MALLSGALWLLFDQFVGSKESLGQMERTSAQGKTRQAIPRRLAMEMDLQSGKIWFQSGRRMAAPAGYGSILSRTLPRDSLRSLEISRICSKSKESLVHKPLIIDTGRFDARCL